MWANFVNVFIMQQPLLALEDRIFGISGLAMAAKDADEADDNMSTNPEEEEGGTGDSGSGWDL